MSKEKKSSGFRHCDLGASGLGGQPSGNNLNAHKILDYFNRGFKLHHEHDDDCTDVEMGQKSLL